MPEDEEAITTSFLAFASNKAKSFRFKSGFSGAFCYKGCQSGYIKSLSGNTHLLDKVHLAAIIIQALANKGTIGN